MPGSGLYSSGDGNPSRTTTRLIPTHKLLLNTPIIAQEGTGDCQTAVARMMLGTILAYPEVHRLEESVDKYLRLKADLLNWAIRKGIFERHWGKPCSQTFVTDMIPHEYLEHLLVPLRVESWWHYLAGGPPSESRLLEELRHYRPVGLFLAPVNGLDSQGHLVLIVGALGIVSADETFNLTNFVCVDPHAESSNLDEFFPSGLSIQTLDGSTRHQNPLHDLDDSWSDVAECVIEHFSRTSSRSSDSIKQQLLLIPGQIPRHVFRNWIATEFIDLPNNQD